MLLAQSSRKSPASLPAVSPTPVDRKKQLQDAILTEETKLTKRAQRATVLLYEHIKQSETPDYLPTHAGPQAQQYKRLAFLRGKCKQGMLTDVDFQLLSLLPGNVSLIAVRFF